MTDIRNPFRIKILREQFDAMIRCFDAKHHDLIRADGSRHMGNRAATSFWRGFDGKPEGRMDRAGRQTPAYACFRAGEAIAKREQRTAQSSTTGDKA